MFPGVGAGASSGARPRARRADPTRRALRAGPTESALRAGQTRRALRAGRVRAWIPVLVAIAAGVWVLESLSNEVWAASFTTVDTRRARVLEASERLDDADVAAPAGATTPPTVHGFVDARWEALLRRTLAGVPSFDATDPTAPSELLHAVAALPFVAEVGVARVRWPDGLELPVRMREPAACVRSGEEYYLVSTDGVVLPGAWPAPPWLGGGYVPVIGPNDGAFDGAVAGRVLTEPRHRDALAVAVSMRARLGAKEFEAMGPPLIDATRARETSATEPGALLRLQGKRVVYFGRAPDCGEPGELPVEKKWDALVRALDVLRASSAGEGARDWSVLDARWDVPTIQWREPAADAPPRAGG